MEKNFDEEIRKFFDKYKRTFTNKWMTRTEKRVFRKRLFEKYPNLSKLKLIEEVFYIMKDDLANYCLVSFSCK